MISSLGINRSLQAGLTNKTTDMKKASETPSVQKNDRADQIAKSIANGSYKLDISKTARAIAQTLV